MSGFGRIGLIGVGMMGASLSRAAHRAQPRAEIIGYDVRRPPASIPTDIDRWADTAAAACHEADLIILATPVKTILELLPEVAGTCGADALVTDTGSTKAAVCAAACQVFTRASGPHFIGGHPMAGREREGAAASDPDLLRGAAYALCANPSVPDEKRSKLRDWVRLLGAHPVWIEPEDHDRIAAKVSHLPQVMVVALASLLDEAAAADERLPGLTGSALRELLRIASSPYPLWDDICRTNSKPMQAALIELADRLRELAGDLEGGEGLERRFREARNFRDHRLRVES